MIENQRAESCGRVRSGEKVGRPGTALSCFAFCSPPAGAPSAPPSWHGSLVDLRGLEPLTPWLQNRRRNAILLARLAFSSVMKQDFTWFSGGFVPKLFPNSWPEPLRWHNFFVHSFRLGNGFLRVSCGLPTQLMLMRNIAGQRSRITVAAMLEAMIAVVHDRLSDRAPPRQKRG